jgi:hypothetical protein
MTWQGEHPEVHHLEHDYETEATLPPAEMKRINERLQRSKTLPKYDITIYPNKPRGR